MDIWKSPPLSVKAANKRQHADTHPGTKRSGSSRRVRSPTGSTRPSQNHSRQSGVFLRMPRDRDSSGPGPSLRSAHGLSSEATRSDSCGSQLTRGLPETGLWMAWLRVWPRAPLTVFGTRSVGRLAFRTTLEGSPRADPGARPGGILPMCAQSEDVTPQAAQASVKRRYVGVRKPLAGCYYQLLSDHAQGVQDAIRWQASLPHLTRRATEGRPWDTARWATAHARPGRRYRPPGGPGLLRKALRKVRKSIAGRYYQPLSGHAAIGSSLHERMAGPSFGVQ